jgi:hypothetical protein
MDDGALPRWASIGAENLQSMSRTLGILLGKNIGFAIRFGAPLNSA